MSKRDTLDLTEEFGTIIDRATAERVTDIAVHAWQDLPPKYLVEMRERPGGELFGASIAMTTRKEANELRLNVQKLLDEFLTEQ
jgi:hypothetical protein